MATGELLGKPSKLRRSDLRWTSILSRGSRNTPICFMLQKPGLAMTAMGQSWLQGFTLQGRATKSQTSCQGNGYETRQSCRFLFAFLALTVHKTQ